MEEKKMFNRKSSKRGYSGVISTTIDTRTKIIKMENQHEEDIKQKTYYCPECGRKYEIFDKFWIKCDHCEEWYHGDCVGVQHYQSISLDRFHCPKCEKVAGPSTHKPQTNFHRHDIYEEDPSEKVQSGTSVFVDRLCDRIFEEASYTVKLQGNQLTQSYLIKHGFNKPILVENKEGLYMVLPERNFSVKTVMEMIGTYYEVDVIDSRRQLSIKMPLVDFFKFMDAPPENRDRILNCISLEVSKTKLSKMIRPPNIVNKLSWVENVWPACEMKPEVSKYCLMSMRYSYTDFHIDFGGTSVWYHVLNGEKIFYLIEPTPSNLAVYERWMNRPDQTEIFLPDMLENPDGCRKLVLRTGQTLFIPTGWIHAVLTVEDSIVFGGNFLHSLNIKLQLDIYALENRLQTADKFLFPYFELTNWYAVPSICKLLQDNFTKRPPSHDMIEGVKTLLEYLRDWNNKSKEENSLKNGDFSPYAPKGAINTSRLMKDLHKSLTTVLKRHAHVKQEATDTPGGSTNIISKPALMV